MTMQRGVVAQYVTDFSIFGLAPYWKKVLWDLLYCKLKKYAKIAISRLLDSPLGGLQRPMKKPPQLSTPSLRSVVFGNPI